MHKAIHLLIISLKTVPIDGIVISVHICFRNTCTTHLQWQYSICHHILFNVNTCQSVSDLSISAWETGSLLPPIHKIFAGIQLSEFFLAAQIAGHNHHTNSPTAQACSICEPYRLSIHIQFTFPHSEHWISSLLLEYRTLCPTILGLMWLPLSHRRGELPRALCPHKNFHTLEMSMFR